MQTLVDTKVINKKINRFITIVSEKYDLDSMELMAIWINHTDEMVEFSPATALYKKVKVEPPSSSISELSISEPIQEPVHVPPQQQPSVQVQVQSSESKCGEIVGKKRKSKKECSYVLLRGPKKGTMCGCTVKNPDHEFCPKHNSGGGDEDGDDEKKVKKANPTDDAPTQPVVTATSTLLRKNKSIDKLWHESTGLVFESSTNRVVIGKCEGDEVKPLSQDDIAVCKQNGFKFVEKEVSDAVVDDWVVSNPDNNELRRNRNAVEVKKQEIQSDTYGDVISDVENILQGLAQPIHEESKKKDENVGMSYDLSDDDEEFLLEEE